MPHGHGRGPRSSRSTDEPALPRKPPLVSSDLTDHDLPGIGHRYELSTADGGRAVVVIHHSGRRDLYVVEHGRDQPQAAVTLTDTQARTLGAILGGAYFKPAVVEEIEAVIGGLRSTGSRSTPARRPWAGPSPSWRSASGPA